MIVKNEEAVLKRCLESIARAVDEIIIVDTGSTDNTKAIAKDFTDKVYDFKWINDFSAARNEAFSKATMDYQMWLDADDVVSPESLEALLKLKASLDTTFDIVTMKYVVSTDTSGNPLFVSTRGRLFNREKNCRWQDPVHECIPLIGKILSTEIAIHHKKLPSVTVSDRNLRIYKNLEKSGKPFTPRQQYYFARELKDHKLWRKAAGYYEKFLNSGKGWSEDNISSCYDLAACYYGLNETEKVLPVLVKSFIYDAPRAEICCEIGYYYKRQRNYAIALKWFHLASTLEKPNTAGFVQEDYYGYIPNIEACVCCSELGDFVSARKYNEQAAACKPQDTSVKQNRIFLASK